MYVAVTVLNRVSDVQLNSDISSRGILIIVEYAHLVSWMGVVRGD